jgi:hypothetical protein
LVLHDVSTIPHELTQMPELSHEPVQQAALLVQAEPMAVQLPPPESTGGGDPLSGVVAGQQAWLDWPQLSMQLPPQHDGVQQALW